MMIEVKLPNFLDYEVLFSLNKTKKEIAYFLLSQNIPMLDVVDYINTKVENENGRTTLFIKNNLILVRLDYFNNSIRYISILAHEIIHVVKRIINDCEKEEAEAYLFDYIFEEIMKILKPSIDYTDEYRDLEWLNKMIQ